MYGARPLKRAIQREVLDPLALRVLQGDFKDGDLITVHAVGSEVQFRKAEKAVPA